MIHDKLRVCLEYRNGRIIEQTGVLNGELRPNNALREAVQTPEYFIDCLAYPYLYNADLCVRGMRSDADFWNIVDPLTFFDERLFERIENAISIINSYNRLAISVRYMYKETSDASNALQ